MKLLLAKYISVRLSTKLLENLNIKARLRKLDRDIHLYIKKKEVYFESRTFI